MSTDQTLPLTPAAVRRVAVMRAGGRSWAEVAAALGATAADTRRTYERRVGGYQVVSTRAHNRQAAMAATDGLTPSVTDLLHHPADADGLLTSLRDSRHRDVLADEAACIHADPETFVPWDTGSSSAPAIAICGVCPVRGACLADALDAPIRVHGVWGGLSARARTRVQQALEASGYVFPTTRRAAERADARAA